MNVRDSCGTYPHTRHKAANATKFLLNFTFTYTPSFNCIGALPRNIRIIAIGVSGRSAYSERAVGRGGIAANAVRDYESHSPR